MCIREGPHPVGVRGGERLGDLEGAVLAAVVDDHHFDAVQGLIQHRPDGRRETLCVVVGDDDHGDVRHLHLDPFVFPPDTPKLPGVPRPALRAFRRRGARRVPIVAEGTGPRDHHPRVSGVARTGVSSPAPFTWGRVRGEKPPRTLSRRAGRSDGKHTAPGFRGAGPGNGGGSGRSGRSGRFDCSGRSEGGDPVSPMVTSVDLGMSHTGRMSEMPRISKVFPDALLYGRHADRDGHAGRAGRSSPPCTARCRLKKSPVVAPQSVLSSILLE